MVPLVKTMPSGLIVPSLVILPVKLVLVTQTPAAVDALGLSKLALMLTQAANAGGAPPPIRTAASEVEASHQFRRAGRPGPAPIRTLPSAAAGIQAGAEARSAIASIAVAERSSHTRFSGFQHIFIGGK
jgi:hypothetical protein